MASSSFVQGVVRWGMLAALIATIDGAVLLPTGAVLEILGVGQPPPCKGGWLCGLNFLRGAGFQMIALGVLLASVGVSLFFFFLILGARVSPLVGLEQDRPAMRLLPVGRGTVAILAILSSPAMAAAVALNPPGGEEAIIEAISSLRGVEAISSLGGKEAIRCEKYPPPSDHSEFPTETFCHGTDGDDEFHGTSDWDTVYGNEGNDTIYGGPGDDNLSDSEGCVFHCRHPRHDEGDDTLYGDDGNDILRGGRGDDHLMGGEGNDILYGDPGDDTLYGGPGDDSLAGNDGKDIIYGEDGDDTIEDSEVDGQIDYIDCGEGKDTVRLPEEENDELVNCENVTLLRA